MSKWRNILSWQVLLEFEIGARIRVNGFENSHFYGAEGTITGTAHSYATNARPVAWFVRLDDSAKFGTAPLPFYQEALDLI
jgi:hypothetical protein